MVARTKQRLRADINRSLFVRRQSDWRVPIESQLFLVVRPRFDVARFMGVPVHAADLATLVFGVEVVRIGRIWEHPESIAVIHIFPLRIGDATGILRLTYP